MGGYAILSTREWHHSKVVYYTMICYSQVQTSLYSQLAAEFSTKPLGTTGVHLRELVGVAQLLFILREYYSLTGDAESVQKHSEVRPYLLLIIKQFVTKVWWS